MSPTFRADKRMREKIEAVNRSVNISSHKGQSLLSGRKGISGMSSNNSLEIERAHVSVGLNKKLNSKYISNTGQKRAGTDRNKQVLALPMVSNRNF